MSGSNPFRRRGPAADAITQREGDGRPPLPVDNNSGTSSKLPDAQTAPAPRPQKTVRIASPPVPPSSSPPRRSSSASTEQQYTTFKGQPIRHRGSPPPPSQEDSDLVPENDDAVDPFNLDADASGSDDEGNGDTEEWKPNSSVPDVVNPPLDQRLGDGQHDEVSHPRVDWSNAAATAASSTDTSKRATMDVDAFKRLLLTGDTGTATGLGISTPAPETAGNGSYKTDLGAVSKQQNLESQSYHEQDEHHPFHDRVTSQTEEVRQRKKPPPPKTRHGKLIRNTDEPVTAIDSSVPSQNLPPDPWTSTPSVPDSSKPLPQTASDTSDPATAQSQSHSSTSSSSKTSKRPPTPPLARRRSQMTHGSPGVSRSNSARMSVNANKTNTSNPSRTPSTHKIPPPPPSSRRIDSGSTKPSSLSISSGKQRLSHIEGTPENPSVSTENDGSDISTLHRSSSGSIKGFSGTPRKPHASNVPPKPPPPRRAGGAPTRPSLDESRPNTTLPSDESVVTGNTQERESTESANEPSNASEILADLSQLQREVDDLRGQYETRRPSR